jgi:hypothetical protein
MTSKAPSRTWRLSTILLFATLLQSTAHAQTGTQTNPEKSSRDSLQIINPRDRDVPIDRARVLLITTCRVVAEEFHREANDVDVRLDLIVGEPNERYSIEKNGRLTLYLDHWDETRFVDAVITGALQQLTPPPARRQMLIEVLRRSDRIAPVSTRQLRDRSQPVGPRREGLNSGCVSAVRDGPCPWPN